MTLRYLAYLIAATGHIFLAGYSCVLFVRVAFLSGSRYVGADVLWATYALLFFCDAIATTVLLRNWAPKSFAVATYAIGGFATFLFVGMHATGMIGVYSKP